MFAACITYAIRRTSQSFSLTNFSDCLQPDAPSLVYVACLQNGTTALIMAVNNAHVDVIKALLLQNANVDIADSVGTHTHTHTYIHT